MYKYESISQQKAEKLFCSTDKFVYTSSTLGEGNGTPLQDSCLENPVDGGAWWATVHGGVNTLYFLHYFTFLCNLEITILICALYIISLGH